MLSGRLGATQNGLRVAGSDKAALKRYCRLLVHQISRLTLFNCIKYKASDGMEAEQHFGSWVRQRGMFGKVLLMPVGRTCLRAAGRSSTCELRWLKPNEMLRPMAQWCC